jgi:cold shock CspA family protein
VSNLYIGTLVRFAPKKFGVLAPHDESPTIYVHFTKLPEDAKENDVYEFRIGNGLRGDFAFECKRLDETKQAETRKTAKKVRKGRKEMAGG